MNKDKIKQLRLLARTLESIFDDIPQSHIRCVKDSMKALDDVAEWYDNPVQLVKDRFNNPNIDVRLEGDDLVFKPDFTAHSSVGLANFKWTISTIQDYIRGYDWLELESVNDVICYTAIDYDEVIVDFETKEIRINADYYVSLL